MGITGSYHLILSVLPADSLIQYTELTMEKLLMSYGQFSKVMGNMFLDPDMGWFLDPGVYVRMDKSFIAL